MHVKGKKVAHFKNRKTAAQITANITNAKASYIGLVGEEIHSEQVPSQPYQDQNKLVARFILDQIKSSGIQERPRTDAEWRKVGVFNSMINHLVGEDSHHGFCIGLKNELIAESRRRNIALELKNAGFSIWRNITE